jgi:hypothetical protein
MSTVPLGFDPNDCDCSSSSEWQAPPWLSQLVRGEVRPFLLEHRNAALKAWARWHTSHKKRIKEIDAWDAGFEEHLRQQAALPPDQQSPTLPDGRPEMDYPLPPPRDHDLSEEDCWAGLLAVHDKARVPDERIGPADSLSYACAAASGS